MPLPSLLNEEGERSGDSDVLNTVLFWQNFAFQGGRGDLLQQFTFKRRKERGFIENRGCFDTIRVSLFNENLMG